jgi:hypothetical protein
MEIHKVENRQKDTQKMRPGTTKRTSTLAIKCCQGTTRVKEFLSDYEAC